MYHNEEVSARKPALRGLAAQIFPALVEEAKDELGDDASDTLGSDVRPVGQVADPVTLTSYDPDTPYFMAEYDLTERG